MRKVVFACATQRIRESLESFTFKGLCHVDAMAQQDCTGILRRQSRRRATAHFLLAAPKAAMPCIAAIWRWQNACGRTRWVWYEYNNSGYSANLVTRTGILCLRAKPRRWRHATGMPPRAAFRFPHGEQEKRGTIQKDCSSFCVFTTL